MIDLPGDTLSANRRPMYGLLALGVAACSGRSEAAYTVVEGPQGASSIVLVGAQAVAVGEVGAWEVVWKGPGVESRRIRALPLGGAAAVSFDRHGFVSDDGALKNVDWSSSVTLSSARSKGSCGVTYTPVSAAAPFELAIFTCATGTLVRTVPLERPAKLHGLADGFVLESDDGSLTCLEPDTGEERWRKPVAPARRALTVADGVLLALTGTGIEIFDSAHGDVVRRLAVRFRDGFQPAGLGPSTAQNDLVVFSTRDGRRGESLESEVAVVDMTSARVRWRHVLTGNLSSFVVVGAVAIGRRIVVVGFRGTPIQRMGDNYLGPT